MPMNAYRDVLADAGDMPMELQLDLLVDGELSEADRATLLRGLEARYTAEGRGTADQWRALALRFLQRQSEKETVRQLMAGGEIMPAEIIETQPPQMYRFPKTRWITLPGMMATAAGLLIAATSALITLYMMHTPGATAAPALVFQGTVPGEAVGFHENIPVSVPIVRREAGDVSNIFPASIGNNSGGVRRAVVIQPDGRGNVIYYPVNTLKVY